MKTSSHSRFSALRLAAVPLAIVVAGSVVLTGCLEIPPLTFTMDERIDELHEPAADAVRAQLASTFGEPLEPVIWEAMPARMHGARGEVTLEDEDESLVRLELDLDEGYQMAPIEPGQPVVWTYGDNVGAVRKVASYEYDEDEELGILTIDEPLPLEDADGMVSIAPGHVMKQARPLYARHCQHCHGTTGDGQGPTAWSMVPKPRDFRMGIFKYKSTRGPYRPSREDIVHTLDTGVAGTSMPSFKVMLSDEEKAIVSEYVIWLANRGEIEARAIEVVGDDYGKEAYADAVADEEVEDFNEELTEFITEDLPEEFTDWGDAIASKWNQGQMDQMVVRPTVPRTPMTPESIARGRAVYLSDGAKCVSCHGESGLGNGPQTYAFTRRNDGDGYNDVPGLHDDWGHVIQPRNLHTGVFRFGRRPIDLYRRIYAGITGAKMPGFGGSLSEEQIWDVVNYVLALGEDPTINDRITLPATPDDMPEEVAVTQ